METKLVKTKHSSKRKALLSLMTQTTGATEFYVVIPGVQTLVLHTDEQGWSVETAETGERE